MSRSGGNKFIRAIRHLKSTQIDERLQMLNEVPANNTSSFYIDLDVTPTPVEITIDIPGVSRAVDFDQDDSADDTTGLFDDDGTILTIEPPGDTSAILGPMISQWYSWGNFTRIGYIRQSDRRAITLATIDGEIADYNEGQSGNSLKTGVTNNLTQEQVEWFRDQERRTYYAFYPGPPSGGADSEGRYPGETVATGKTVAGQETRTDQQRDHVRIPQPWSLKGSGLATLEAMPLDNLVYLISAALLGIGWALDTLSRLGANISDAIQVFNSRGGIWDEWFGGGRGKGKSKQPPRYGGYNPDGTPKIPLPGEPGYKDPKAPKEPPFPQRGGKEGRKRFPVGDSYQPEKKKLLSEDKKRILREIKKPYQTKEEKKEKLKGYRPRFFGTPGTPIDNPMKKIQCPPSFKPMEEKMWGRYEKRQNTRASQERMNQVGEYVLEGGLFWEFLNKKENARKSKSILEFYGEMPPKKIVRRENVGNDSIMFLVDENGKKETMLQSEYNEMIDDQINKQLFAKHLEEQENNKDPLFKRVSQKINPAFDYEGRPSKDGYPNTPPPEMVNGYHPDLVDGLKVSNRFNRLDPTSAEAMPPTGNPHIDAKVQKAKRLKKILRKKA
tara:strand:+ start:812 stop:2644 length:1833 start_codon:yes stop_codon:yes gene_type:complete